MAAPEFDFVTGNQNKAREVGEILGIPVGRIKLQLTEIQGPDAETIVRAKAEEAYGLNGGRPVLIEDTSLSFDAYGHLPGPYIKWFLDDPVVGSKGLCEMVSGRPDLGRGASAVCILDLYDGQEHRIFPGVIRGSVSDSPRGKNGFGWDDIFVPEGYDQTFAEMDAAQKNAISMRARALEGLKSFLQENSL